MTFATRNSVKEYIRITIYTKETTVNACGVITGNKIRFAKPDIIIASTDHHV